MSNTRRGLKANRRPKDWAVTPQRAASALAFLANIPEKLADEQDEAFEAWWAQERARNARDARMMAQFKGSFRSAWDAGRNDYKQKAVKAAYTPLEAKPTHGV